MISCWLLFLTRMQEHLETLQVRIKIQAAGGSFPCCCPESPFLWKKAFTAVVPCQRQLLWKRRILMVKQMRGCTKLFNNLGERITKQKEGCVLKWSLEGNWSKPDSWANLKSCCLCLQRWVVGTICGINSYFRRRWRSWRIQAGAAVVS